MKGDWCTPVSNDIAFSLHNGVRVMLFYGDKDYICNWRGGEALANGINWNGQQEYRKAPLKYMHYEGKNRSEYKKHENFTFMKVYDAGHMVPGDQKSFALHMIKSFIEDTIQ